MKTRLWIGAALLSVGAIGAAHANDSGSELAAGGLVLVKTEGIAMQREDLTLSPDLVRVRYEMRNDRGQPVAMRVAFPMPEIPRDTPGGMETGGGAGNIDIDPPDSPNFMNFKVLVDGKAIVPEVEVRAILPDGRDVAAELRQIGGWRLVVQPRVFQLSDEHPARPNVPATPNGQWDLDAPTRAKLVALGALHQEADGYETLWKTLVTFHWRQTFPPGVTIVEHSYVPVLGFHLLAPAKKGGWLASEDAKPYCIDQGAAKALQVDYVAFMTRRLKEQPDRTDDPYIPAFTLAYILHTAGNWDGPIGTLHLALETGPLRRMGKGLTVGIMSLCTDLPLKRSGPGRFEATARDYQPKNDLRVLLVPR
jgi:hypothetical protein